MTNASPVASYFFFEKVPETGLFTLKKPALFTDNNGWSVLSKA